MLNNVISMVFNYKSVQRVKKWSIFWHHAIFYRDLSLYLCIHINVGLKETMVTLQDQHQMVWNEATNCKPRQMIEWFCVLYSLRENYGRVFSLKLGSYKFVMASAPEAVKEMLVQKSADYAGRQQTYFFEQATLGRLLVNHFQRSLLQ